MTEWDDADEVRGNAAVPVREALGSIVTKDWDAAAETPHERYESTCETTESVTGDGSERRRTACHLLEDQYV